MSSAWICSPLVQAGSGRGGISEMIGEGFAAVNRSAYVKPPSLKLRRAMDYGATGKSLNAEERGAGSASGQRPNSFAW